MSMEEVFHLFEHMIRHHDPEQSNAMLAAFAIVGGVLLFATFQVMRNSIRRRKQNPQRPYAKPREEIPGMIWSDLHGDMQSQAEMSWPDRKVE